MSNENPGESFERLTAEIFDLMGYSVERNALISGSQVDLVAKKKTGPFTDTYIVECKDHAESISITVIRAFHSTLLSIKQTIPSANGIFVSKKQLTKEAKRFAESVGIQHITLSALERKLLDLDRYAAYLIESFQEGPLYKHYIDLDAYPKNNHITKGDRKLRTELRKYIPRHLRSEAISEDVIDKLIFSLAAHGRESEIADIISSTDWLRSNRDAILKVIQNREHSAFSLSHEASLFKPSQRHPLLQLVDKWLAEKNSSGLIVLGDYGTGKTSSVKYLAARYAQLFLESDGVSRCPLIINLKDYPNGVLNHTLKVDIAQQLNCSHLDWPLLYRYLSKGRFLMLFDGFDEMGFQLDARLRRVHFASVLKLIEIPNNKVIVTGRPSYFPSLDEYEEIITLLNIPVEDIDQRKFIKTINLASFSEEQIQKYIDSFSDTISDERLKQIKDVIDHVYNLRDLAERPFLLDLILKTIPDCDTAVTEITPAVLYELYTTKWIDREYAKGEFRWLISKEEKKAFITGLAWLMLQQGTLSIHFSELSEWVREHFDLSSPETVDYLAHDIRTCSFLRRDDRGNYSFIHRSFMEYFVAVKIVEKAREGINIEDLLKDTSLVGENANSLAFALDLMGESIFQVQGFIEKLIPHPTHFNVSLALNKLPDSVKRRVLTLIINYQDNKFPNLENLSESPYMLPAITKSTKLRKKELYYCDFCGISQNEAGKIIRGTSDSICDLCVGNISFRENYIFLNNLQVNKLRMECSFCRKDYHEVKYIYSNSNKQTAICNDCHDICCEILVDDEKAESKV